MTVKITDNCGQLPTNADSFDDQFLQTEDNYGQFRTTDKNCSQYQRLRTTTADTYGQLRTIADNYDNQPQKTTDNPGQPE